MLLKIGKGLSKAVSYFTLISFIGTLAMMLLNCADVFMSKIFLRPITGAYEITQLLMLCTVMASYAYGQTNHTHINMGLIIGKFHPIPKYLLSGILELISTGIAGVPAAAVSTAGTETLDNGDGTMRYRDFTNHIAFTCTDTMQILPGRLYGAVAITDGNGAYVTGRNVTDALSAFSGNAEDFLKDYVKAEILSDFDALYGGHTAETDFLVSSDDTAGRLAAGTLRISNADHDIAASVILYTSAYADGTENYICKTFFVPAAESSRQTDLAAAVTDMGAVRRK